MAFIEKRPIPPERDPKNFPFLFNPENGRVLPNTKVKAIKRLDLIPCKTKAGPAGGAEAFIEAAQDTPPPVESPDIEKSVGTAAGPEELMAEVHASADKDELISIGKQLNVKLTKAMKVETMRGHLLDAISELEPDL